MIDTSKITGFTCRGQSMTSAECIAYLAPLVTRKVKSLEQHQSQSKPQKSKQSDHGQSQQPIRVKSKQNQHGTTKSDDSLGSLQSSKVNASQNKNILTPYAKL